MYGKGRYTVFAWHRSVFLMFDICITFNLLNLFLIWDVKAQTFPKCQQLASILAKVVDDFATGSGIQQDTTPFSTTLITRLRFVSSQAIWVAAGHDHLLHAFPQKACVDVGYECFITKNFVRTSRLKRGEVVAVLEPSYQVQKAVRVSVA